MPLVDGRSGRSDRERDDRALAGAGLPDPGLLRPTAAEEPRHEAPHRESSGQGAKVVIVDDVVTSGGSLLQAVKAAREAGCKVVGAMALVDREEQDGAANIRREVEHFIPLFRRSDFEGTADAPGDRATTRSEPPSISEASPLAASAQEPSSLEDL